MSLEKETSALYDLSKQIKDPQIKEIFSSEKERTQKKEMEKDC